MLEEVPEFNKRLVENKGYGEYITNKHPGKKTAILSCIDTHLTELLPTALGIHNRDVRIIKNAGAVTSHLFSSVTRSLLVAIIELEVEGVTVIAHLNCGTYHMNSDGMIAHTKGQGVKSKVIDMICYRGVGSSSWLGGLGDSIGSVRGTVRSIENHPLIPKDVRVRGFIIDSLTDELTGAG